jgi:hypothetical protein
MIAVTVKVMVTFYVVMVLVFQRNLNHNNVKRNHNNVKMLEPYWCIMLDVGFLKG